MIWAAVIGSSFLCRLPDF